MTDLSSLSNEQLMGMLQPAPAAGPAAGGLSTMSDADLMSALNPPSPAADAAKSAGIGPVKGAIGLLGGTGDLRSLASAATDKIGGYFGASPESIQGFKDSASSIANGNPLTAMIANAPTSADVRGAVESKTGPLYEPKTTLGHYLETVGEFAPAAAAGPGSIAKRLVTQAVIPGVASEAAGQATAGTEAEPYARLAGAVAGGGVGPALERAGAARGASAAVPTIDEVKAAAKAGYDHPAVAAVQIQPKAVEALSDSITGNLNRQRLNDRLAPQTHALLDDLKTPVSGATHTIEDLETTRQRLGDIAGNFNDPVEQKAASQAIKALDTYSANIPQSHLIAGDAKLANGILTEARANYASAKTAEKVSEKLRNADLQAGSTYSGGNLNNATRQKLRPLLTSKSQGRGLSGDELQTIEDTVRGSTLGNAARAGGKLLGGGGGLGAVVASAAGHTLAGPLGLALPAVGYGLKKVGDAITRANSDKIVQQILARSPLGITKASRLPATQKGLTAVQRMLLASSATLPLRQSATVDNARQ